ncbi:hypothetical protein CHELA41_40288 [Hyphomicrobiales bacterium]|nr:hypothetical protein CHELA41_40288 [Hyphomicrobiales bacterium]
MFIDAGSQNNAFLKENSQQAGIMPDSLIAAIDFVLMRS